MQKQIIPANQGLDYDWANDHIFVKAGLDLTEGRVTLVEDTLKPSFHLPRHYHKKMTEIFYILAGEVAFQFDEELVVATVGTTVNIPPGVWHEVTCEQGGKLLTVFSPGGFDQYLAEMASLTENQFTDDLFMTTLAEKYDTWNR